MFDPQKLVSILLEALEDGLTSVVLFGSRARGEAKGYSDWDVFLVADGIPKNPFERGVYLREVLFSGGVTGVSLLARTRAEFESDLRPIYLDLAHDGVILLDREGYIGQRFFEIKEIVKEAGLRRIKRRGSWVWQWESQPVAGNWEINWKR